MDSLPNDLLTKSAIDSIPLQPGIYFFYNIDREIIYIGKAKILRNRVKQYFKKNQHSIRTTNMVKQIEYIQVICSSTEHTALLLENQAIKKHQPRYNVLLKDDKNYPFIYLSKHKFPRLGIARNATSKYLHTFGPFTKKQKLHAMLDELQGLFQLRTCRDSYFRHRTRPCMLHDINRCSAPCVDKISPSAYKEDTQAMTRFLRGDYQKLITEYTQKMQQAVHSQDYEKAANYRDIIQSMQNIIQQQQQTQHKHSIDIFSASDEGEGIATIHLQIRNGQIEDSRYRFFAQVASKLEDSIIGLLVQIYTGQEHPNIPDNIACAQLSAAQIADNLAVFLPKKTRYYGKKSPQAYQKWYDVANTNLQAQLQSHYAHKQRYIDLFNEISTIFNVALSTLECMDISHHSGSATYGSCIVCSQESGIDNRSSRVYSLNAQNNDYDSLYQLTKRRFGQTGTERTPPNVLLIDGGKGQLQAVQKALDTINLHTVKLIAITKNAQRTAGEERYFILNAQQQPQEISFSISNKRTLEHIRDQAHNFAIRLHRRGQKKQSLSSTLLQIPGLGKKRYQNLIQYLGGKEQLDNSTIAHIAKVPGISHNLATQIHQHLHNLERSDNNKA